MEPKRVIPVGFSQPGHAFAPGEGANQLIERLRARKRVTLDEWACMSDVVVDVNWEVGKQCHQREVEFSEFADAQKEGYAKCLSGKVVISLRSPARVA